LYLQLPCLTLSI